MDKIDYCKNCKWYDPEWSYTCRYKDLPFIHSGNAINRVTTSRCKKFMDEVDNITIEEAKEYILPFGKNKGHKLEDVSSDYIYWLLDQDWLMPPLKVYVKKYQIYLHEKQCKSCSSYNFEDSNSIYREVGYGELC